MRQRSFSRSNESYHPARIYLFTTNHVFVIMWRFYRKLLTVSACTYIPQAQGVPVIILPGTGFIKELIMKKASSGMLRRVTLVRTYVSEELSVSFIRVTRTGELGRTLAVTSNRLALRRNTKIAKIPDKCEFSLIAPLFPRLRISLWRTNCRGNTSTRLH
jgi:hypothetical protein